MTNKIKPIVIVILIYLIALSFLCYAHVVRTSKDAALNGEELAVAFRNVFLLPQHVQSDGYATNFSGTIFYWASSYVLPISINSQRIAKIFLVAFLPLIMFGLMKRIRPQTAISTLLLSAVMLAAVPAYSWYGVQAIEAVLASVFAFLMVLLLFDFSWEKNPLFYLLLIGGLMVWCAHFYGEVFPVIILSFIFLFSKFVYPKPNSARFMLLLLFSALVLAGMFWPKYYFGPQVVMFSGGGALSFSLEKVWAAINTIGSDLFVKSCSYLIGGDIDYPAFPWYLNGIVISILAFFGAYLVVRENNKKGIWVFLLAGLSLLIGLVSGDNPGIRRVFPFVVCWIMFCGLGMEQIKKLPKGTLIYWAVFVYLMITSLVVFFGSYQYVGQYYKCWLQREFTYFPGNNYEQTIEALLLKKNIKFSRQIESLLHKNKAVESFVELHNKDPLYNEGKYAFTGDGRLILRGPMTDSERIELEKIYSLANDRSLIEAMCRDSREYMFQNPDTVMMVILFGQRRGLLR